MSLAGKGEGDSARGALILGGAPSSDILVCEIHSRFKPKRGLP